MGGTSETSRSERPNIFQYHDYRSFLVDWFEFLKETDSEFSIRSFSKKTGISLGLMPMILNRSRKLSAKTLYRIGPHLCLSNAELSYLEFLRGVAEAKDSEREGALSRLEKFREAQKLDPLEANTYQYLSKWYYVAIRELAHFKGFKKDYQWIQSKLKRAIKIEEIIEALEFLLRAGFLAEEKDGKIVRKQKELVCHGGLFRVAAGQFHRDMFDLAGESFGNTARHKRKIKAYTASVTEQKLSKIKKIIDRAHREIAEVSETNEESEKGAVYHFSLCAFPLTKDFDEPEAASGNSEKEARDV